MWKRHFRIPSCLPHYCGNEMQFPIPKYWKLSFHSQSEKSFMIMPATQGTLGEEFWLTISPIGGWGKERVRGLDCVASSILVKQLRRQKYFWRILSNTFCSK